MRFVYDNYRVDCTGYDCDWTGLLSETETEPFEEGSCPKCKSEVEPVED